MDDKELKKQLLLLLQDPEIRAKIRAIAKEKPFDGFEYDETCFRGHDD